MKSFVKNTLGKAKRTAEAVKYRAGMVALGGAALVSAGALRAEDTSGATEAIAIIEAAATAGETLGKSIMMALVGFAAVAMAITYINRARRSTSA